MLVKNGKVCENQWTHLNTEAIPEEGSITIPMERWVTEHVQLENRKDPVGVRLLPDSNPEKLDSHLNKIPLIIIEFPVLADGRVFSFAKLLRRKEYEGEIRAIGNYVTDQMYYMQRVGVNSFELPETVSKEAVQQTLSRFSVSYQ